jgi:hypothetical protein
MVRRQSGHAGAIQSQQVEGLLPQKNSGNILDQSGAVEHVAKMHALRAILEKSGYQISQMTTDRPGYVVFEDDHQVVAEPFRGTGK